MKDLNQLAAGPVRRIKKGLVALGINALLLAVGLIAAFFWFVVRVEVPEDHFLVLVNKTGSEIPDDTTFGPDQVVLFPGLVSEIAKRTGRDEDWIRDNYKGIRYETWGEGRYFKDPWHYRRMVVPFTQIDNNHVGVLVRKYGASLQRAQTVAASEGERGPCAGFLVPGRYAVNPLAYTVKQYPQLQIPEGHMGVVTLLSGPTPANRNTYIVQTGERGVQPYTLAPGRVPYNPYEMHVQVLDVRSHRFDMHGDTILTFPSQDSFSISIEATIEWAIRPDKVPEVTVAYGDEHDIVEKIILPNARSISRIQGSRLTAREFMSTKRQEFQDRLLAELKQECYQQGIEIKSALVRAILPPAEIAALISKREQADQEIKKYGNQIKEAEAGARLAEQKELQARNRAIGEANQKVVKLVKEAEQLKEVAVKEAAKELEVAKLRLEAATKQASAIEARGRAEANVVLFQYKARAEPLKMAVAAFGDGQTYAQYSFLQKVAPSIKTVLTNTEGPFADVFRQLQQFGTVAPAGTTGTTTGAGEGGE